LEVAFSAEITTATNNLHASFTLYIDGISNKTYRFSYSPSYGGAYYQTYSGTWIVSVAAGTHTVQIQGGGDFVVAQQLSIVKEILP